MRTIRGRFDGSTIELLEDAPTSGRAYVLVTFLDSHLELAVARGKPTAQRDVIMPPAIGALPRDSYRRFTVGSIMTRDLATIAPTRTVADATHLMRSRGITSVLVEPDAQGAWGIMTMRDVLQQIVGADRSADDVTVSAIASRPLITVPTDMSLRDCASLMIEKNIRRVVVAENDRHTGLVSDTDIFLFVEEHGWGPE